ncbi:MAG: nitroreductase family deazaflavin-dependent oxidoreductase [Marmoricola sp.]
MARSRARRVLVHHVGRKSGDTHVSPMMYLPGGDGVIYVIASKGGAPTNPDWYYNLVDAGSTEIEVGTETFRVDVAEETGDDRDRVYAEQAALYPGFAEYAEKTDGIRVIPVLRLTRTGR